MNNTNEKKSLDVLKKEKKISLAVAFIDILVIAGTVLLQVLLGNGANKALVQSLAVIVLMVEIWVIVGALFKYIDAKDEIKRLRLQEQNILELTKSNR